MTLLLILCKLLVRFGLKGYFVFFTNIVTITYETIKIVSDIAKTLYWRYDDISKTLLNLTERY